MKKQEKKFVLAALALLAITGLLALASCKNDTVPEPTRYTVKFDKNAEDASGEMQSQIFTEGVEQELSVNQFKRATYTFSGWSEDKAATAPTYKDKAKFKATKDTTLYAVWTDNGTVDPVTFSLPDGTKFYFGESIEVSLETTTDGAIIQYKRDDGEWMDYTEETPISVTTSTTITARATKDGLKPSAETTATYTVRKLDFISVTPPERTVYSVGQSFDPTGMVVTATYNDNSQREVTGWETDFSTVADVKGLNKPVTVSYTEGETPKTTTFTVTVFPAEVKVLTGYTSPNNTDDSWTYVEFGEWPQTIKADSVTVGENEGKQMGMFTYYLGEDSNYYVKHSDKYYKVEPIVWRVLTEDYKDPDGKSTGNALLLAESILTGGVPYYDVYNVDRTGVATIRPNNYEHSAVRAWLNGLEYQYKKDADTDQTTEKKYLDVGFLQTAFTESARNLIADTSVDNSAASTFGTGESTQENPYAYGKTKDKIFLLSQQEATNSEYGFGAYSESGKGNTRIRFTTDYAEATGAYQDSTGGYGGRWWLRSPYFFDKFDARFINILGYASINGEVNLTKGGVVPALSISLQ